MVIFGGEHFKPQEEGRKEGCVSQSPSHKAQFLTFQSLRITAFSLMGIGDTFL